MPANDDGKWQRLAHEAFGADDRRLRLPDAVAGMVAATGPLVVGLVVDQPHAGLVAALGGLNVALSMAPGRPGDRAPWGVATLVAGTALIGLATAVHPIVWLSVAVAFVVVGVAALLRVLGPQGALVGFVVSAVFIIGNGLAGSAAEAPARAAQFFAGGVAALVLMMLAGATDRPARHTSERAGWREVEAAARAGGGRVRRYAVVLGATVGATTLLYRTAGLDFGYWIPLTALAVLQPDAHASRVRLVQRASGTVLGCLVVALAVAASVGAPLLVGAVALTSFGLFALRERSYHWLVTLLTPTALLMISTVDFQGDDIVVRRVADTAVGLAVAMVVLAAVSRFGPTGTTRRRRGGTGAGTAPVGGRRATARRR